MHDITKIREDFSAAAASYDRAAEVQRAVASHLVELAMSHIKPAARVLDIGAGTGFLADIAQKLPLPLGEGRGEWHTGRSGEAVPHSTISQRERAISWTMLDLSHEMLKRARAKNIKADFVVADAHSLPFDDGVFDAAMSSLAFQWVNDRAGLMAGVNRVLRNGSVFAFATLGQHTLAELRESFAHADPDKARVNNFVQADDWRQSLLDAGFRVVHNSDKIHRQHFAGMEDIIASLRAVGATHKDAGRPKNMTGRERFAKAEEFYVANFADAKGLRVSWQALYFVAEKQSS